MAKERISLKTVSQLQPGGIIWDDLVRGFGVRRQRTTPVYVLKYRFKGRQRFMTIGPHGSPWSPDDARQEAKRLLGLLASKERPRDPAAERDSASREITFSEMAERYLNDYAPTRKKNRSIAEDRRNLRVHVLPAIGAARLSDISRIDLVRFMASLKHKPVVANRCIALISHILNVAEKWGLKLDQSNPCRGLDRYREAAREIQLNSAELTRLGQVLRNKGAKVEDGQGDEDYRAIACIWLLVFTGARLAEILSLEWKFIKWDEGYARLPDSKTGSKNLPLPEEALDLLRHLKSRQTQGSDYVLPGNKLSTYFTGIQKPWRRIRAAAAINDVRLHDLRHCYASVAVADGISLYLVGGILGHRQVSTTQRYAHLAIEPLRVAANRTASKIASFIGAPSPLKSSA